MEDTTNSVIGLEKLLSVFPDTWSQHLKQVDPLLISGLAAAAVIAGGSRHVPESEDGTNNITVENSIVSFCHTCDRKWLLGEFKEFLDTFSDEQIEDMKIEMCIIATKMIPVVKMLQSEMPALRHLTFE